MTAQVRSMLMYLSLAELSAEKRQSAGRDRFLILAGAVACECGWLDVAAECRTMVLANNQQHLIGTFDSFPDALRDEEFQAFLAQLRRLCPIERAEHFLRDWNRECSDVSSEKENSPDEKAFNTLSRIHALN